MSVPGRRSPPNSTFLVSAYTAVRRIGMTFEVNWMTTWIVVQRIYPRCRGVAVIDSNQFSQALLEDIHALVDQRVTDIQCRQEANNVTACAAAEQGQAVFVGTSY